MTWIDDEERTYTNWYDAVKGGWKHLGYEERMGFLLGTFVVLLVTLAAGMEIGHYLDPNKPIVEQVSEETVVKEKQVTPDRLYCKTCASSGETWIHCTYETGKLIETPDWCTVKQDYVQMDRRDGHLSGILNFEGRGGTGE